MNSRELSRRQKAQAHPPIASRREFLVTATTLSAVTGLVSACCGVPSHPARPNLLFIMTDQQHAGMMSCAGNPYLQTPALDRLAASGIRFELAYASNPLCVPARTSMMTGRYPSFFGFESNAVLTRSPQDGDLNAGLGHLLRAAGYRTLFGGKRHWPRPMDAENIGFTYFTVDERDELAAACAAIFAEKQEAPFAMVASFINPHDICYMAIDAFTEANGMPLRYPRSVIERQRVREASAFPEGLSREQFFATRCPPLPENFQPTSDEPEALSSLSDFRDHVRQRWGEQEWRLHRWAYCRLTERVDAQIGRVLDALAASAYADNTVIIFTSDHGDMDASHRLEHKGLPYEEAARVPLLVSWPGHVPVGTVDREHLVSNSIDLLPTLCDLAGARIPQGLPGRSFAPLALGAPPADWRRDVLIEFTGGSAVRGPRYKYAQFASGENAELLIDMEEDPGEMTNLATNPLAAGVLEQHRQRLQQLRQQLTPGPGLPSRTEVSA